MILISKLKMKKKVPRKQFMTKLNSKINLLKQILTFNHLAIITEIYIIRILSFKCLFYQSVYHKNVHSIIKYTMIIIYVDTTFACQYIRSEN